MTSNIKKTKILNARRGYWLITKFHGPNKIPKTKYLFPPLKVKLVDKLLPLVVKSRKFIS